MKTTAYLTTIVALTFQLQDVLAGEQHISGCLREGVEAGCVMLEGDDGPTYELILSAGMTPEFDWEADVWGHIAGGNTYCMQGVPFLVTWFTQVNSCQGFCKTDEDCLIANDLCNEGYCVESTGQCFYIVSDPCCPLSGPCFDGDPCTQDWACEAGFCSYPELPDDAPCWDDNNCTINDRCNGGVCAGTPRPMDANCNVRVDLEDWEAFENCMKGPSVFVANSCLLFDHTGSRKIDLRDAAQFQRVFIGED